MKLPPDPSSRSSVHWTVRMNRRNRTIFYPLLFLALGSHLLVTDAPGWTWVLLALNYLVFPQAAYWRARHAVDPLRAEMQNLDTDVVLFGLWAGILGFPLWITFMLVASGCINVVVFHGARGGIRLVVGIATGVALATIVAPLTWKPDTDLRTSLLCITAMGLYLFAFASDGYHRAIAQHRVHAQLRKQFEEIQSLQVQLSEQALRDPLTGLSNRRQLDTVLAATLERCRSEGQPLSLLLLDIDHFKSINDAHGHSTGDLVQQAMAQLLLQHVRPEDTACRLGGEEFVVVLDNTPLAVAIERAQELRRAFEALRIRAPSAELTATLSCGVAAFPDQGDTPQALIACADQAMYAAQQAGRNRVTSSARPPTEQTADSTLMA